MIVQTKRKEIIMKNYRVCPTLDSFMDIKAKSEEEAIDEMMKLAGKVVLKCQQELDKLGFKEMGADFPFCTDSWYSDSDKKKGNHNDH